MMQFTSHPTSQRRVRGAIFTDGLLFSYLFLTGFSLLNDALGDSRGSFFGRGAPRCFLTDSCGPERGALQSVWPAARHYRCASHVPQQAWRWLSDARHGVKREQRQELLAVVKRFLYAPSPEEFLNVWEAYSTSSIAEDNASFTRYQ